TTRSNAKTPSKTGARREKNATPLYPEEPRPRLALSAPRPSSWTIAGPQGQIPLQPRPQRRPGNSGTHSLKDLTSDTNSVKSAHRPKNDTKADQSRQSRGGLDGR